jgi:hypothetical protein
MSQLSVADQHEVDSLNDDIRRLTQENKEAFSTRMRLEAEKNKLENLLTNNLMRRKDELMQVQYTMGCMCNVHFCNVTDAVLFIFCKNLFIIVWCM